MQPDQIMRLAPSAVRAYRSCPHAYALGYVEPLPEAERVPVPALALGSAVHAAIARFLRVGGWARRGADELLAMLPGVWDARAFPDPATEAAAYEQARTLLEAFHAAPYPAEVTRELGIERTVTWLRPRRGLVASGRLDRVCLRPDGELLVIDYKSGRPPADPAKLRTDVQSVFYRTLAADSFRWLGPARTTVAFRFVGAATTVTINFDEVEFQDAWADIEATAADIRAARLRRALGASLVEAFPLARGPRCAGCAFSAHCDKLDGGRREETPCS